MKYDHLVKYNGEYYPAGTDVPVDAPKESESAEDPQEKTKQVRKSKES